MGSGFHRMIDKRVRHAVNLAVVILVASTILVAGLPQGAQAAGHKVPCDTYYIVKTGDTSDSIAYKFGVFWRYIAFASNLKEGKPLKVGTKLCIPPKWWPSRAKPVTMTASASGKNLTVTIINYGSYTASAWNVRVSDTQMVVSGDYKVGQLVAPKNNSRTRVFKLPPALFNRPYLTVCIVEKYDQETICKQITHTI